MIADYDLIRNMLFKDDEKLLLLRELLEKGTIRIDIPEIAIFEVCKELFELNIPTNSLKKIIKLVIEYFELFIIKTNTEVLSDAVEIYKSLRDVKFCTAICLAFAKNFNEFYITTDIKLAKYLRENGFDVLTVDDVIKTFR